MPAWRLGQRLLDLARPRVIAILNLTPDSFYDGGSLGDVHAAVEAARAAVRDGADMLDVGGESTRPGADRVDPDEQIRRVVPAIRAIRATGAGEVPISVDTTSAAVAEAALDAGADAVNDVSAGTDDPRMLPLVGSRGAGVILMHRLRPPGADSYSDRYAVEPEYGDVVSAVASFLRERDYAARRAGVAPESIVLDPGLGFGKSVDQNLELIARTGELLALGRPILSALSRKSFVGRISLGRDSTPGERLAGTLALSIRHALAGASLFRVHDVAPHVQAFRTFKGLEKVR